MPDERLPGPGHYPTSLTPNPGDPGRVLVDWADFRGVDLHEAFFGWTARRLTANGALFLQTGVSELLRFHRRFGSRPPAGFVVHMTRCGSTLLARALHRLSGAVCFSEAPPLNAALLASLWPSTPEAPFLRREVLRATVLAFTHCHDGAAEDVYFKTSFGTGRMARVLKELWPETPVVFLFRDPLEVLASWESTGGPTADLARNFFGDEAIGTEGQVDIDSTARIIGRICRQAVEDAPSIDAFIEYEDLAAEGLYAAMVASGARSEAVAEARPRIEILRQADAKRSGRAFEHDSVRKRAGASLLAREAAERHLIVPFNELRRLKQRGDGPQESA